VAPPPKPVPRRLESPTIRDPGVSHGRFRPLQRTDGRWIVYDPERPPARRTAGGFVFDDFEEADRYAQSLVAAEVPAS